MPARNGRLQGVRMMARYRLTGVPLEAQARFRQGRESVERGNDTAALEYFRQAAFIAPDFTGAYREAGDCLHRLGRYDEAILYYKKALKK